MYSLLVAVLVVPVYYKRSYYKYIIVFDVTSMADNTLRLSYDILLRINRKLQGLKLKDSEEAAFRCIAMSLKHCLFNNFLFYKLLSLKYKCLDIRIKIILM